MSTPTWEIRQGDALELLAAMPAESVDAVVTDPPYGIGFMGHAWDQPSHPALSSGHGGCNVSFGGPPHPAMKVGRYDRSASANRRFQSWADAWAREVLRVLKPGGHLLAFGAPRTYHRLACGVEDAGFEIRDCVAWLYGSGFPKSLDVSKAIDKGAGHWRGRAGDVRTANGAMTGPNYERSDKGEPVTAAAAAAAAGWGTALKPAFEPVVVARKPLVGTVAQNWLQHGTGALNIAGCSIDISDRAAYERNASGERGHAGTRSVDERGVTDLRPGGGSASEARWPANVALDEEAAVLLDEQTGNLTSGANPRHRGSDKFRLAYGDFAGETECVPRRGVDTGGASRFFYCAKASTEERNHGLGGFAAVMPHDGAGHVHTDGRAWDVPGSHSTARANHHPTVKPIALMRWLVRLVTPSGGLVLDPFAGSGTTGIAALREGFSFVGIEREAAYVAIARARIRGDAPLLNTAAEVA